MPHSGHAQVTTWVNDQVRDEFERAGHWTDETWIQVFLADVERDPKAVSVVDEERTLTRGEVLSAGRRLAAYLYQRGARRDDVVTLVLPNWWEFVVVHAAIGLLGCVVNPLLPKVGEREMGHIMRTAKTKFVFAAYDHRGRSPWQAAVAAADSLGTAPPVISVRGGENSLSHILARAWEEEFMPPVAKVSASSWDTVTFTSGTESLPKGVVHSHQTTMFGLRAYVGQRLRLTSTDSVYMPSPICHASGIQWGLRTAIYCGAPLVLQDRWDPVRGLQLIDDNACTYTLAATPFIVDLVSAKIEGGEPNAGETLRYLASGGAPIPRRLVQSVRESFGADLMAVFGSSETYVTTATKPGDNDSSLASDGCALDGVEVAIVDEVGRELPAGVQGEIVTRGPQVFLGYLGDPDLTQRAFRGEWYRFGDVGCIDELGMLRVTGRIKDIVIRGGENISVREVEELLIMHPAVEAAAVVGYPDDRLGERCCAVVVCRPTADVSLPILNGFLSEQGLATFKLPERLEIVASLPMTATGKVRKAELRRQISETAP